MSPPLLDVAGLRVRFGGLVAVDDVSIRVHVGEIVGLIGPNGAGKTTLLDALTGFVSARGEVRLDGKRIDRLPPNRRAKLGLSRTFQSLELFDDLTVRENVLVAMGGRLGERLLEPFLGVSPDVSGRAESVLERVGLAHCASSRPTELSHAERKLAGVARALARDPRLVLLDEPAAGFDRASAVHLGEQLRLVAGANTSILLIDHDMGLVFRVCDRVYVVDLGRVIAQGTPAEVRANPEVIAAYLGDDDLDDAKLDPAPFVP